MSFSNRKIGTLSVSPIAMGGAHWSLWADHDDELSTKAFNAGIDAGTALHSDLMTLANQFLDGFGGGSDTCLARLRFERNTNVHVKSPA